jgi:hypothetical protein
MRKYELENEEWEIVQQLCDVLEVCHSSFSYFRSHIILSYSRTQPSFFHVLHQTLPP